MIKKTDYVPPSERNMNGHYHSYQPPYQRPQGCGRIHDREWETPVNGRAKHRSVPAPTSVQQRKNKPASAPAATKAKQQPPPTMETHSRPTGRTKSKISHYQRGQRNASTIGNSSQDKLKGVMGYHQSATACYVGGMAGNALHDNSGVYGVYSETKYIYTVNGLAASHAQSSAAAAFFAR